MEKGAGREEGEGSSCYMSEFTQQNWQNFFLNFYEITFIRKDMSNKYLNHR